MVATTEASITIIGEPNMDSIATVGISISFMIILFVMGFDRKTEKGSALLHVFLSRLHNPVCPTGICVSDSSHITGHTGKYTWGGKISKPPPMLREIAAHVGFGSKTAETEHMHANMEAPRSNTLAGRGYKLWSPVNKNGYEEWHKKLTYSLA
jgi:hypothetical protein